MVRVLVVALSARTGGGGSLLLSQVSALSEVPDLQLTVHASGTVAVELAGLAPRVAVVAHPPRPLPLRLIDEQIVLAWRAGRYDIVYVPGNFGLLLARTPQVVCQQNAWYYTPAVRTFRRRFCSPRMRARLAVEAVVARASVRRAHTVIAVSETMKSMLQTDLGPLPHLRVITSVAPRLTPAAAGAGHGRPYVLTVAPDYPHKDLAGLVEAFVRNRDLPPLTVVGGLGEKRRAAFARKAADRVSFVGQIDDRQRLADLYAGAVCVVAHSYFESFGMTPAEALSCGTPVAASDIAAHREVCGDRACYYDPADLDGLADAVRAAGAMQGVDPQLDARTWADNATELATELVNAAKRDRR